MQDSDLDQSRGAPPSGAPINTAPWRPDVARAWPMLDPARLKSRLPPSQNWPAHSESTALGSRLCAEREPESYGRLVARSRLGSTVVVLLSGRPLCATYPTALRDAATAPTKLGRRTRVLWTSSPPATSLLARSRFCVGQAAHPNTYSALWCTAPSCGGSARSQSDRDQSQARLKAISSG
jgi:hypothetical protein